MPTLNEILEKKADRLEKIPDEFLTQVQKVQLQLVEKMQSVLAGFDFNKDGTFKITEANLDRAAEIDLELRQVLSDSEYEEAVTEFIRQFKVQIDINDYYFTQALDEFDGSAFGKKVVEQAQKSAINLLVEMAVESEFIQPVKDQITNAVVTGARFSDTFDAIRTALEGTPEKDGSLLHYAKQIAHDSFAVSDRSYSAAVAEEAGASWFKYSGGVIITSRPFCVERHNKYFCKKEIELWGEGKKTPDYQTPDITGHWDGEMEGTDKRTIFATAGGYNCRHSIMAYSVFAVPREDIVRAIDLGFYSPTKAVIEKFGL